MMDEEQTTKSRSEKRDIDVFDYLAVLWSWRRFIIVNLIIIVLLSLGGVLLLPKWYKSTASILPPKDQGVLGQVGAASSILKSFIGSSRLPSSLSGGSSTYNYLAILKSRTVMETIVKEFDLRAVYEVSENSMDKAVRELEGNTEFEIQPEDNITIAVWDKKPGRAAEIANAFVRLLNETSIRLATTEARNNRRFIGERLDTIRSDLRRSEEALKLYQESSGMMIIPDENMTGMSAVANLYALKVQKELERGIMQRTVATDNPALKQVNVELGEIEAKVAEIPQAGIESLRLYREVLIQQKILEFVIPLYEQARVDEQKTVPVIQVLDDARPAERHDKPKRLFVLIGISVLAFLILMLIVFACASVLRRTGEKNAVSSAAERFVGSIANLYKVS